MQAVFQLAAVHHPWFKGNLLANTFFIYIENPLLRTPNGLD
jgi:hypothetical protein